jgi:hypothetical protein
MYMDLGAGELDQTAGVVEVEVSKHDVSNVSSAKAECLDLRQRRHVTPAGADSHGPSE